MNYDITLRVPATIEMVIRVKDQNNTSQAIMAAIDALTGNDTVPEGTTIVSFESDDPSVIGCDPV